MNEVYPPNSISMLESESGNPVTGWVDNAYKTYAYKIFCPNNFLIMVDLTDNIAKGNPDLDMGTIEDFFVEELRKVCIAHIVARVVTDKGINIEMYGVTRTSNEAFTDNPRQSSTACFFQL